MAVNIIINESMIIGKALINALRRVGNIPINAVNISRSAEIRTGRISANPLMRAGTNVVNITFST